MNKYKKVISVFLALLTVFTLFSPTLDLFCVKSSALTTPEDVLPSSWNFQENDDFYYVIYNHGLEAELIMAKDKDYTGKEFVIPAEVDGMRVKGLFHGNIFMRQLRESGNIDTITSIRFESDIRVISDDSAFYDYNETRDCEEGLFYTFANMKNLKKVTLPENFQYLDAGLFYNCPSLKTINLPDTIQEIGAYCFYGCASLESVTLPKNLVHIFEYAFAGCSKLKNVTTNSNLNRIDYYAFYGCTSLESIVIPSGVDKIDRSLFQGCTSLKSVKIPNTVTIIYRNAFYNCKSLTNLTLPKKLYCIDEKAFYKCSSLSGKIKLPSTLQTMGVGAFAFCTNLNGFKIAKGNEYFSQKGGVLFNKDKTKLYYYPVSKEAEEYKVPSSVKTISAFAFAGAKNTEKVIIGKNVTSIPRYAFYKSKIRSVELPNSITKIYYNAFDSCKNLKSITLPTSLRTVSRNAFKNCTKLKGLTFPKSVKYVNVSGLGTCTKLKKVTFKNKNCTIEVDKSGLDPKKCAFTIYGYKNSTAQKFAKARKLPFSKI